MIHCIRYDYMFRRLTMAIFRVYMKYLFISVINQIDAQEFVLQ